MQVEMVQPVIHLLEDDRTLVGSARTGALGDILRRIKRRRLYWGKGVDAHSQRLLVSHRCEVYPGGVHESGHLHIPPIEDTAALMMEPQWPRNGVRCLHGQGQPMTWRTTSAILLLALGIVLTTASVDGHQISRVVGGQNADPGEWPWQVGLIWRSNTVCGGALISPSWVVSAAHCVDYRNARDFMVVLGALNLNGANPIKVYVAVKQIIIHPIFDGDGTSGDLALLELALSVSYNDYIQPVPLPYQDQEFPDGKLCWLTGWGQTTEEAKLVAPQTLQEVPLPLINYMDCNKMFQKSFNMGSPFDFVKKDMICAGYPEGKKDGCQGDSGGPLVCKNGESWILVGIVSWGIGCARPDMPGVYTKVSNFCSWIQDESGVTTVSEMSMDAMTEHMSTLVTEKTEVDLPTEHLSTLVTEKTEVDLPTEHVSTLVTEKTEVDLPTEHLSTLVTEKTEVDLPTEHVSTLVTEKTEVDLPTEHLSTLVTEKTEVDLPTEHVSTLVTEKTEVELPTEHLSTLVTEMTEEDPQMVSSSKVTNRGTIPTGKKLPMPMSLLAGVFVLIRILDVV
ncbi:uncharacterized protein [Dendrobates tinctorius]|uniref:uncharacterized protein n=1 Tax=Dendrobates tinctorius TaxID=92724 RepID=UPI003CC9DD4C